MLSMSASDRERKIEEIAKKLDETPAGQLAKVNLLAVLELVPMVGGTFATLTNELIPDWKLRRLNRFVAALSIDLEDLKDRISLDYLKKEEFGYLFEKTFRAVSANYQAEKLDALRNLLLNSMLRTDMKQDLKEYLLHLTESLGVLHMRFLVLLRDPSEYYSNKHLPDNPYGSMMTELHKCFPELTDGAIHAVWNDLYNCGILNTESKVLGIGAASSPRCQVLNGRLSDFGKLFLSFVTKPS
jgi:hypothetical protein